MSQKIGELGQRFTILKERISANLVSDTLMLDKLCLEVENELEHSITQDIVHLADDIYRYMGQAGLEKRIRLHRKYLATKLEREEVFWSHWQLVDTLAILRRGREAVEEQAKLFHWTCQNMSDEYILRAVEDTTQALCWEREGRMDEWFGLYQDAAKCLEGSDVTRYWKCLFLRAGSAMYALHGYLDQALIELQKMEGYYNEDLTWEHYLVFWLASKTTRMDVYQKLEDWHNFDRIVAEATSYVKKESEKIESGKMVNDYLSWIAHDMGAALMWAKRYEQATFFLQIAIDVQEQAWTHFFLATCIWATNKDRVKSIYHLKLAQNFVNNPLNRGMYYQAFLEADEFMDVRDDEEFINVFHLA